MTKKRATTVRNEDLPDMRKLYVREVIVPEDETGYTNDWKSAGGGWWRVLKPIR